MIWRLIVPLVGLCLLSDEWRWSVAAGLSVLLLLDVVVGRIIHALTPTTPDTPPPPPVTKAVQTTSTPISESVKVQARSVRERLKTNHVGDSKPGFGSKS